MAAEINTAFEVMDTTVFDYGASNDIDFADDGTPRLRQLTTKQPVRVQIRFSPMSSNVSIFFEAYLAIIMHTEVYRDLSGVRYTGYIDSKSVRHSVKDGDIHYWSFNLVATKGAIT